MDFVDLNLPEHNFSRNGPTGSVQIWRATPPLEYIKLGGVKVGTSKTHHTHITCVLFLPVKQSHLPTHRLILQTH